MGWGGGVARFFILYSKIVWGVCWYMKYAYMLRLMTVNLHLKRQSFQQWFVSTLNTLICCSARKGLRPDPYLYFKGHIEFYLHKYKTLHNCPLSLDFKQISPSVYFSSLQLLLLLASLLSFMQYLPVSPLWLRSGAPLVLFPQCFGSWWSVLSGHAPLHVSGHHMNTFLSAVQPKLFKAFYASEDQS